MAVIAHFLGEDNTQDHVVLDLVEVEGSNEGENLAPYMMAILEDWGIINKLGYFVMDNAGNNDTMMRTISAGMLKSFFLAGKTNMFAEML